MLSQGNSRISIYVITIPQHHGQTERRLVIAIPCSVLHFTVKIVATRKYFSCSC